MQKLSTPVMIVLLLLCGPSTYSDTKAKLIEKTQASVVWIHAFGMPALGADVGYGTGSGYVIGDERLILTNEHVIRNASGIVVFPHKGLAGEKYFATVVFADSVLDLAVLRARDCRLPALQLENEKAIAQGDEVLIFGYPGSSYRPGKLNVSWGIISSDTGDSSLQTTAAINSGNSGGPAVNMAGNCVGTVYAKLVGLDVEGAGFIRNVRFVHDILSRTRHRTVNEYFGTQNFDAYVKICEAAMTAWEAEDEADTLRKRTLIRHSKQLVMDAIDLDSNFAEAHRILGGYFLKEALFDCFAGDEYSAERKVQHFFHAMEKAESIKSSLRYKEDFPALMKWIIAEKSINCRQWKHMISELDKLRRERELRLDEWHDYMLNGATPERLKAALEHNSYSNLNGDGRGRGPDRKSRRYNALIPGTPLTLSFKVTAHGRSLIDRGEFESVVTQLELQCEALDDVRPILGLNSTSFDGADNTIVHLGLNMSNFTFRITSFDDPNPFIHKWSLDCTTNLPGTGNGDRMNAIWSFGLGQIRIPRYVFDFPNVRIESESFLTFRTAFEFRLVNRTWIDMELVAPISKRTYPNVFDDFYHLVLGVAARL